MSERIPPHSREGLNAPFDTMFAAEIRDWVAKLPHRRTSQFPSPGHPDASNGLFGLALSGGGMRSATYCLGVTQALSRYGLLDQADYISTVSGGGYLGTSIAGLCSEDLTDYYPEPPGAKRFNLTREHFPYAFPRPFNAAQPSTGSDAPTIHDLESPATRHVREHSRLLINKFSLLQAELWTALSRYLFSTMLLWLLFFLPPLALLSLLSTFIPESVWVRSDPFGVSGNNSWLASNYWITTIPLWLLGVVMVLALIPWRDPLPGDQLASSAVIRAQKLLLLGMGLTTAPTVFLLAFWGIIFTFDNLNGVNIFDSDTVEKAAQIVLATLGLGGALVAGVGGARSIASPGEQQLAWKILYATGGYLFLVISIVFGHYLLVWLVASGTLEEPSPPGLGVGWFWFGLVAVYAIGAITITWFYGHQILNLLSLQRMYERRLRRAWIIGARPGEESAPTSTRADTGKGWSRVWIRPDIEMQDLPDDGVTFPYHLICTALNLPGSTGSKLLDRNADSFVIAPVYSGSAMTRWCPTPDLPEFAGMPLARAAAISGAAVSPNMGRITSTTLSVITTLFNVRLGWWVANPRPDPRGKTWQWLVSPPWVLYWKEMFGLASHRDQFVYLSDGGHFENLGLYELLRRRCKFIVAVDATGEPPPPANQKFSGLGVCLRLVRIDFGAEVDLDLRPLMRLGETGQAQSYFAVGQIRYPQDGGHGSHSDPDDQTGTLVYIKLGRVNGPTTPDIINYINEVNAAFPHDPTADQQFDQAQFESYRQLGFLAGRAVCDVSGHSAALGERFRRLHQWYSKLT